MEIKSFDPTREAKTWGFATHLLYSNKAAVSNIEVLAMHRCSLHRHRQRANGFFSITASLIIEEWGMKGKERTAYHILAPGESIAIPAFIFHRFRVISSGLVTEVYWPEKKYHKVSFDDIDRLDVGGADDRSEIMALLHSKVPDPVESGEGFGRV